MKGLGMDAFSLGLRSMVLPDNLNDFINTYKTVHHDWCSIPWWWWISIIHILDLYCKAIDNLVPVILQEKVVQYSICLKGTGRMKLKQMSGKKRNTNRKKCKLRVWVGASVVSVCLVSVRIFSVMNNYMSFLKIENNWIRHIMQPARWLQIATLTLFRGLCLFVYVYCISHIWLLLQGQRTVLYWGDWVPVYTSFGGSWGL